MKRLEVEKNHKETLEIMALNAENQERLLLETRLKLRLEILGYLGKKLQIQKE